MHRLISSPKFHHLSLWLVQVMPLFIILLLSVSPAYGFTELGSRSIYIANDTSGAVTGYNIDFTIDFGETLGSVQIQFCSNSPLFSDPCDTPAGLNVAAATLGSQTGPGGFSISGLTNATTLVLTRTASVVSAQEMTFNLDNVTNPSSEGTFYARIQTFATTDASGANTDQGGVAIDINNSVTVSTYVPPYLYFCVGTTIADYNCNDSGGSTINFGYLSPDTTSTNESQMVVATNAKSGYSIQVTGNSMTSGNNVIPAMNSGGVASPGENQFGMNLVANNNPAVGADEQGPGSGSPLSAYSSPNVFKYTDGDVVASSDAVSDLKEYTISYIIDINSSQAPGYYATTLTYIGVGNF